MSARPTIRSFLESARGARKIVVIDFGFLGDSVHLVPALWGIKENCPGAELHTVSAGVGAELLKLAPCVDRAWAVPLTAKSPPWWKHWGILRALRRERFDVAFNFCGSDRSLFAMAFIGAPRALAFEPGRKHFWSRWLRADWAPRGPETMLVYERRRQLLAAGGFALRPVRFNLQVPADASQWAQTAAAAGSFHLSINASTPSQEWPLERWIELARGLLALDPSVQLTATCSARPREQERLKALERAVADTRLRCVETRNIAQLAAILERSRVQIGADSGVLHLAMALGIPTLTVFRQGREQWIPPGASHRHIIVPCRCISEHRDDCLVSGRAACLAGISAEQMLEQARYYLPNAAAKC